jgi:hypothetical protein
MDRDQLPRRVRCIPVGWVNFQPSKVDQFSAGVDTCRPNRSQFGWGCWVGGGWWTTASREVGQAGRRERTGPATLTTS